jgi:hypothetical protein
MREENMKYLIAAALLATSVAGFAATADAAQGCGPGYHRGPYGGCVPNRGVVVVRPPVYRPAPVVVVRPPVYRAAPVVVVPRARVCPRGMVWAAGRCRY